MRPAIRPDLLRLAAGEAIRTSDTSDALCRTTLPKRRGSAPLLPGTASCRFHCRRSLRGRHSTDPRTTSHQARLLRRGFRAAVSNEPGRLPSVCPGSLDPGRLVAFVDHSRGFASHPLARRSPGSPFRVSLRPRQRSVALAELPLAALALPGAFALGRPGMIEACARLIAPHPRSPSRTAAASASTRPSLRFRSARSRRLRFALARLRLASAWRKMRLSDFCNQLTTRAPDVAARFPIASAFVPPGLSTLRSSGSRAWPTSARAAFAFPRLGLRPRVELRLTANLQLWLRCNLRAVPEQSPERRLVEHLAVLGSRDRWLLREMPPSRGLFSRRRACRPAADVLCRDRLAWVRAPRGDAPTWAATRSFVRRRLVKDDSLLGPGRLPSPGVPCW